ncbi:MAG: hypothetical protein GY740_15760 [Gammaproteobacteria bacterium]|nr:hypothetical protein [Gammaproteobacteria bacterium]
MSHEPSDATHYRPRFANPAGRISELENMLEFAKQEIENFRDKWIAEKRKADRLRLALEQTTSELLDEIRVKYSEDDLKYPSIQRSYRADIAQVEANHKLLQELEKVVPYRKGGDR